MGDAIRFPLEGISKSLTQAHWRDAINTRPDWLLPNSYWVGASGDSRIWYWYDGTNDWPIWTVNVGTGGVTITGTYALTDGDKGDITVSASGQTFTIDNASVTLAKIQNAAASSKLLGSGASGSGSSYSEITLGTGLSMSGTTLNAAAGYEASGSGAPVGASFAWVNQGDASTADGTRALRMTYLANASANVRILKMTAPAAPYSIYMRYRSSNAIGFADVSFGLILRNSTSGRFLFGGNLTVSEDEIRLALQRWASATSHNADRTVAGVWESSPWLRFDVTSTTAAFYASPDGWNWTQWGATETFSDYVTATGGSIDEMGFGGNCSNGAATFFVYAFQTTAPT